MLSPNRLKSTGVVRRQTLSPDRRKSTDDQESSQKFNRRSGSFMVRVREDPEDAASMAYRHGRHLSTGDFYDEDDELRNMMAVQRGVRTPSPNALATVPPSSPNPNQRKSIAIASDVSPKQAKDSKLQRRNTSSAVSLMRKLKIQKKSSPPSDKDACKIEVHHYSNDPTIAWEMLKVKQPVKAVKPMALDSPMRNDYIRFVCLADTHGAQLDDIFIPDGDVLLVAGNFTRTGHPSEVKAFNQFLGTLPHKYKVIVAGNHELTFDSTWQPTNSVFGGLEKLFKGHIDDRASFIKGVLQAALAQEQVNHPRQLLTNGIYIEDESVVIHGIQIYGSPWIPLFDNLAFNLPRGQKLLDKWNHIPSGVDVLVTQTPPLGYGDLCHDGHRLGCVELLNSIRRRIHPKYHVFGHVHESYGCTTDGYTKFINASLVDRHGSAKNPPILFDIALPVGEMKD